MLPEIEKYLTMARELIYRGYVNPLEYQFDEVKLAKKIYRQRKAAGLEPEPELEPTKIDKLIA